LEGLPDGRAATGDAALLRLVLEHRLEVHLFLFRLLTLEACALLIEVEDRTRAA
jgi:hypothetical protein